MAEWLCSGLQPANIGSIPFSAQLMRILVTGSSGFIGFHLTKKLLKLNHKVIGIDNHNDYYDVRLKETRTNYFSRKF